LRALGYSLLARNFRTRLGELDLVMEIEKKELVVFVEVKTRTTDQFGSGEESVTIQKQMKMVKTAVQFVKARKLVGRSLRFDVVVVDEKGVRHIANAFEPGGHYTL
jgi:putative endonuclease